MMIRSAFAGSTMQLHVELQHITPAIWRRLVVSAEVTLDVLHDIFQVAFGWTDSHLHDFRVGDARFGMADVAEELLLVDERAAPIGAVACAGTTLVYLYDYGDSWEHTITVESIAEPERNADPVVVECLGGARACPPEDCGGVPGYENLLRVLTDPADEEYRDMKRWVGRGYDPEKFDLDKVNKKLRTIGRRFERQARSARRSGRR